MSIFLEKQSKNCLLILEKDKRIFKFSNLQSCKVMKLF